MLPCVLSRRTSKCGKNISDTPGYRLVCHVFVLTRTGECELLAELLNHTSANKRIECSPHPHPQSEMERDKNAICISVFFV